MPTLLPPKFFTATSPLSNYQIQARETFTGRQDDENECKLAAYLDDSFFYAYSDGSCHIGTIGHPDNGGSLQPLTTPNVMWLFREEYSLLKNAE